MRKAGFVLSVAMAAACARGESIESRTEAREYVGSNGKVFRYRWAEKTPAGGGRVPLVFFLHGAGERGTNNVSQLHHGVPDIVAWLDANEPGFKLVAGQVPTGLRWVEVNWSSTAHTMPEEPSETMGLLLEFMDTLLDDADVDTNRVYATGISMGGYGTWDLISRRPEVFAAALPICGGADLAQASKLASMPIWTFHGSKDTSVPVSRSRSMMSALWAAGSDAHYWEHPDAPHNVWTRTYQNDEVLTWFFSQTKTASPGSGGGSGGEGGEEPAGPAETDHGSVRLESETFSLAAQASGALKVNADTFTIASGAGTGGLDRIVFTRAGSGYANAHISIGDFVREDNAVLDVHAPNNTLGCAAPGTAGYANITCTNGVETIDAGAEGTISAPIVPWARGVASSSASDTVWTHLLTYHAEKGFRFLEPETEYETFSFAQTGAAPTPGSNVRVTASGVVDFAGDCNVNSFSMLSTSAATVYVTNGTMRIASGVLDLSVWNSVTVKGSFDFGDATAYITSCGQKSATLDGSIAGRDVVFADNLLGASAGKGLLTVKSTGSFTGDEYVNGSMTVPYGSFMPCGGRSGNVYVNGKLLIDGGTLNGLFGSGIVDKPYTGTRTLIVGDNNANGNFAGSLLNSKGNFNFTKTGSGTQVFGGDVSIGGDVKVNGGSLILTGTLAAKSVAVSSGASFAVDFKEKASPSLAEPRLFIRTTSSMEGVSFGMGGNVAALELREGGKELWATPKTSGFMLTIVKNNKKGGTR